jgi:D-3-phosphoglycerate dehydrogenase / 2-oxoglutarate reductase
VRRVADAAARPRVFIPDPIHADGIARLAEHFVVAEPLPGDAAAHRHGFAEADATIVRNITVDKTVLDAAPRLKVIAKHGAGVDNIDMAAATARGIVVANVPGGNADAVAEATVALMLAALRRVPEVHRLVVTGGYNARFTLQFGQLFGRTLGLVGIGNIGARVARICARGFNMRVLAYDPVLSAPAIAERGAEKVDDLASLLAAADVVSLHLPLNEKTRHLICAAELAAMKPTAILVNAARGPLVDEDALAEALRAERIAGAGLDVLEVEPPAPDNPLLQLANVVLSPHTAGNTVDAARQLALASADIVIAVLSGRRPEGLLNHEAWERRR